MADLPFEVDKATPFPCFGVNIRLLSVGTGSDYDLPARKPLEGRRTSRIPDMDQFEACKGALGYCDGEGWKNYALVNRQSLEALRLAREK